MSKAVGAADNNPGGETASTSQVDDKGTTQVVEPTITEATVTSTDTQVSESEDEGEDNSGETDPRLKKIQNEAKNLRNRLKEAQAKVEAYEKEKLTESERLKLEAEKAAQIAKEAQDRLNELAFERAVEKVARTLNLDEELALRLVDKKEVEFDDDGKPTNLKKYLKSLTEKWPNLKGNVVAPTLPATNPDRSSDRTQLTLEDIKKMSTEEVRANMAKVQETLKASKQS